MKARTMHRDRQPSFFVAKPVSVTPEKQKIWRSTCTVGAKQEIRYEVTTAAGEVNMKNNIYLVPTFFRAQ
jgi:hypothetical protein